MFVLVWSLELEETRARVDLSRDPVTEIELTTFCLMTSVRPSAYDISNTSIKLPMHRRQIVKMALGNVNMEFV